MPDTETQLAALNELYTHDDEQHVIENVKKALSQKNNRIVAKAAKLCEEKLLYRLETELIHSYQNQLKQADKNCIAKSAIMRALVALDCHEVDFYLAGLRYVQNEPVWGGQNDTAVDIRCSSAMGLISTSYPRAMLELVNLLNDPEPNARIGAARAISYGLNYEAALVLRQKLFCGDKEPEVLGECMSSLLSVEPEQSLPTITAHLNNDDDNLFELAALALGDSHQESALEALQHCWKTTFAIEEHRRRMLFKAITLHRSQEALDWLLERIETHDASLLELGIECLAIHKHKTTVKERMTTILETYGNRRHHALYREYWA
jgi:HEAT repeat protein